MPAINDIDGIPLGVDIGMLKKKFEDEHKSREFNGGDSRFLRLPEGKTRVRILPPYSKDVMEFYRGFLVHSFDGKSITCFRNKKFEPVNICPLCQVTSYLYSTKDDADRDLASLIRAKQRFYYNVVVREYKPDNFDKAKEAGYDLTVNPDEVKILSTGSKLFEKIRDFIFGEYGDITHVFEGRDIIILKTMKRIENGKMIPSYDNSYPAKDASPLAENNATIRKILSSMHNLNQIVEGSKITPAEMVNTIIEYFDRVGHDGVLDYVRGGFKKADRKFYYSSDKSDHRPARQPRNVADSIDEDAGVSVNQQHDDTTKKNTIDESYFDAFAAEIAGGDDDGDRF